MKKRLLGALTALMVMSMGITASAAESVTASDAAANTITVSEDATSIDGVTVTGAGSVTAATSSEVSAVKTQIAAQVSNSNVTVRKVLNISAPDGYVEGTPVTVTVTVPGLDSSKSISVLHITSSGAELLSATISGTTVSFVTKSFSPFAIIETSAKAATASGSDAHEELLKAARLAELQAKAAAEAAQASTVISPKTGEAVNSAIVLMMAAAAVGAVAAGKKFAAR